MYNKVRQYFEGFVPFSRDDNEMSLKQYRAVKRAITITQKVL